MAALHETSRCPLPVAICGIGLRLPHGVRDTDAFWDVLVNGKDLRDSIPENRYNQDGYTDKLGKRSAIKTQYGYFIDEDLGALDTSAFSMSRTELERCDPQQRQFLQVAREALENAGEADFRGKNIGCYVGNFSEDWLEMASREQQHSGGYIISGHGDLMIANRTSYEYDLKGPSMVIKTGCSASLVGLHEACRALQNGDCTGAIVGGVNLIMSPTTTAAMTEEGMLSPEGSCKTFDKAADGYVRGEAVNAVYIMLLEDAIRGNYPVRAVIRASGTNSDGKSSTLLTPNGAAHEALMRKVYADAGLDPSKTAFVECHGTGTPTGDPLEAGAVGNVFGENGIMIGSVKPNVGHSEGASGLTSLVKAVLALENNTIPPNIKFSEPNPKIPFATKNLRVPIKPESWPTDRDRRVSINSFGIGGSNAHIILEAPADATATSKSLKEPRLLLTSASTAKSAKQYVEKIQDYLKQYPSSLDEAAYTLSIRRESLPHRCFIVADPDGSILEASPAAKAPLLEPQVVMVFSGQGAQWPQMGKELLLADQNFKSDIAAMDEVLKALPHRPTWNIEDELLAPPGSSRLDEAELAQPLCTALQVALVNQLRRAGIRPSAVVGHSSGEIGAAYAAGMISLEKAIITAYYRGLVSKKTSSRGGMGAVGLGVAEVKPYLDETEKLVIACDNSPNSVTISGDVDALQTALDRIKQDKPDTLARRLKVDMAYHSYQMRSLAAEYEELLEGALVSRKMSAGNPMFSSVTTEVITSATDLGPSYWVNNLTSQVRFNEAAQRILREFPGAVFLEVGPHSTLGGPLRQIHAAAGVDFRYVSALVRGRHAGHSMLSALGHLYQNGVGFDLSAVMPSGKVLTNLPSYSWDYSSGSFWYESRVSKESRFRQIGHHKLLGLRVPESSPLEPIWRNRLSLVDEPWLADHKIRADAVFPFAGYLAMAGEAVRQHTASDTGYRIRDASVHSAMVLGDQTIEIITYLRPLKLTKSTDSSWYEFSIVSYNGSLWTKHCEGHVKPCIERLTASPRLSPDSLVRKIPSSRWYDNMDKIGVSYGPEFQALADISSSVKDNTAAAVVTISNSRATDAAFPLHPVAIDNALQLILVAMVNGIGRNFGPLRVPITIRDLTVFDGAAVMDAVAWAPNTDELSVELTSGDDVVLRLSGLELKQVEGDGIAQEEPHAAARLEWLPDFDMIDHSTLFSPPFSIREDTKLQEEMTLLCVLETALKVRDLEACNWHFEKYRSWLKVECQRAKDGTYPILGDAAKKLVDMSSAARRAMIDQLCVGLAKDSAKGNLALCTKRIFDNCEDIFSGKTDTLELLMQGGLLTKVYDCISYGKGDFFKLLSHTRPNLRVLEVGAGTGGTTEMILRNIIRPGGLPSYDTYTFTDISAGFFVQAQERFSYAPNMEYKVFDISQAPFEQGFKADTYDVILAPNVIHATEDLRVSLSNLHSLLKPGGLLVMTELCAVLRTPNYTFGNFAGWWLGEADGRPLEPYVSVQRWDEDLKACGFSGVDTAVLDDEEPYQSCAAIVSTKLSIANMNGTTNHMDKVSVLADNAESHLVKCVVSEFERIGIETNVLQLGDAALPFDQDVVSLLDVESFFFEDITADRWSQFQRVLHQHQSGNIIWVTKPAQVNCQDPRSAQSIGVARSIRAESKVPFLTVEVDPAEPNLAPLLQQIVSKIKRSKDSDLLAHDKEYVIDEGIIKIGRYQPFTVLGELSSTSSQLTNGILKSVQKLKSSVPGTLESLSWVAESHSKPKLGDDEVVIETRAAGLNFKDIMYAMGVLKAPSTDQIPLGLEVTGVVTSTGRNVTGLAVGDRVMAMPPTACFKTSVTTPAALVQRIPNGLSFTEAATIPIVFSTAIEALINVGQLEKGQSVLIHSATGGLGHAAIEISQSIGAEIFATVGSESKARYLVDTYNIPRDHIFQSRDDSFAAGLKQATNGRGVDVVLNSVSGELLHASWECVAEFGKMVELGKRDILDHGHLKMHHFLANRSYCCIDLTLMCQKRPQRAGALLKKCTELLEAGVIRPCSSISCFEAVAVQEAFRWVQDSSHIGKAVVKMPDETSVIASAVEGTPLELDDQAAYLVTGGLGGLGASIATWLAERGARSLIFLSRSAGQKPKDKELFRELEAMGCSVVCVPGHAESVTDVRKAASLAPAPVKGIIHLAMVLRDSPMATMQHDDWIAANDPKVKGAWTLHQVFGDSALDFFVMASSLVTVVEQPGQGNYSASNTFLEAFTQFRRSLGLPASVLNICPIDGVGFVAENPTARKNMKAQGLYFLREPELFDFLELAIKLSPVSATTNSRLTQTAATAHQNQVAFSEELKWKNPWVTTAQLVMGLRSEGNLKDPNTRTNWRRDRRMGFYHNVGDADASANASSRNSSSTELTNFLVAAADDPAVLGQQDSADFLARAICSKVYSLMLKDEELDTSLTLQQLGLDSLMAIELRRWVQVVFGLDLSVLEILSIGLLKALGEHVAAGLKARFEKETKV